MCRVPKGVLSMSRVLPIEIADQETWPFEIRDFADDVRLRYRTFDDVCVYDREICDQLCKKYSYLLYHYTKEAVDVKYKEVGLRCLERISHINEFFDRHGDRFTAVERDRMRVVLQSLSCKQHDREGRIYFTIPRIDSAKDGSICDLVSYFGGESIYWAFKRGVARVAVDFAIGEKLRHIGKGCEIAFVAPSKWIAHGCIGDSILKRAFNEQFGIDGSVNHDIPPEFIRGMRYFD